MKRICWVGSRACSSCACQHSKHVVESRLHDSLALCSQRQGWHGLDASLIACCVQQLGSHGSQQIANGTYQLTNDTFLPAAIDTNANGTVERTEFADFIFHLAVAELKSTQAASLSELED